jgi:hypothetical protein
VDSYLSDANAIQREAAPAFRRANAAYAGFSTGKLRPSRAPGSLRRAERAIRRTRARLARLDPPPEAAELHRRLLRVYDLNARLAGETTQLARYLPAATTALRPLEGANRLLQRELRSSRGTAEQGGALGRYADELGKVLVRLERLRPPPVLAGGDRARRRRLGSTRSLAARLRDAIEQRDSKRVASLLLRFRRVTAGQGGQQTFAADSLRAYTRRYRQVIRAGGAVQEERRRLERSL